MAQPLLTVVVVLVAVCTVPAERLVWHDEFDTLNHSVWNHLVTAWRGGNQEFEYYRNSRNNSFVKDGVLYLRPTLTADEVGEYILYNGQIYSPACNFEPCVSVAGEDIVLPVQSARIRTMNSFSFLYGRVEVRAKMPRGDWIWPAIWMKPRNNEYGGWPASGEIDIIEVRSNKKLTNAAGISQGIDRMGSTLHFGVNQSYNIWRPTHWELSILETGRDFADDFHIFGMIWTEKYINFTVDDKSIGSIEIPEGGFWHLGGLNKDPGGPNIWANGKPMAPFDKEFFIIMNVAVGGTFFPDGWRNSPHPKPWKSTSPHPLKDFWEKRDWWLPTWNPEDSSMRVDYIRAYCRRRAGHSQRGERATPKVPNNKRPNLYLYATFFQQHWSFANTEVTSRGEEEEINYNIVTVDETNFNLYCRRSAGCSQSGERANVEFLNSKRPNLHIVRNISSITLEFCQMQKKFLQESRFS